MKMKKLLVLFLTVFFLISASGTVFAEADSVILINGVEAPIAPEMGSVKNVSDRTFVPVRFVLEYFGFSVTWDSFDKVVMGRTNEGGMFLMQVGNPVLTVLPKGGTLTEIKMDVSPFLDADEGRTYIPVRFIAQAIGYKVGYDELTGTVMLDR